VFNKHTLYHTDGCHLCEQAYSLIVQAGLQQQTLRRDIIENKQLMEEYQSVIPVLEFASGKKLFWPFSRENILEYK
jgi:hypothetical protein